MEFLSVSQNDNLSRTKNVAMKILYKSDNFLIISKDFDVFTNNEVEGKRSVHKEVAELYPELANPKLQHMFYFPHRLDYATSGVICLALNKAACAAASSSFQSRESLKFYLAILRGHVSEDFIDVQLPVGENSSDTSHKMCTTRDKYCVYARNARTCFLVLERGIFLQYPATKVIIRPISGRRHQIRVHCSAIGHTVVGDYTYSNKKDTRPQRTYLHSYRLCLNNSLEPFDVYSEDPFDHLEPQWISVETVNTIDSNAFSKLTNHVNCDISGTSVIIA